MFELRALEEIELTPYFENLWRDYRAEFIAAGFSEEITNENVEKSKKNFIPEPEVS